MQIRILTIAVLALALTGCAAKERTFNDLQRTSYQTLHVSADADLQVIHAPRTGGDPTVGYMFGALGVLTEMAIRAGAASAKESAKAKPWREASEAFRSQLGNVDLQAKFEASLARQEAALLNGKPTIVSIDTKENANVPARVHMHYGMDTDFAYGTVVLTLVFDGDTSDSLTRRYEGSIFHPDRSKLSWSDDTAERLSNNVALWSADNGSVFAERLDKAMEQAVTSMYRDLSWDR